MATLTTQIMACPSIPSPSIYTKKIPGETEKFLSGL